MNRIRVSGWVEKEHRGAWRFQLGFVNGQPWVNGWTAWVPKTQCEVEHRVGDFIHLWVPLWLHTNNCKPDRRRRR